MKTGHIISIISNQYLVCMDSGEQVVCVAMGKLRKGRSPIVGDRVVVERFESQSGIQRILPRRNALRRPAVANVDQAIIVMSTQCPDFATQLVDRLIFQICYADIEPLICVTKMDLVTAHDPVHAFIADYRRSGYQVFEAAKDNAPQDLISALKGRVSVLCGQSGAGKSTLLNSIEPSFQLRTQETSKALGRGRHTTRHCELHEVAQGWVADTPGFSSLDFHYMELEKLSSCIPDFAAVQDKCRFKDCRHLQEPGCAVKEAVEAGKISEIRYAHYQEVAQLILSNRPKY